MKVITAPEPFDSDDRDVKVFLAGGITNCPDWQSQVIAEAQKYEKKHGGGTLEHLVLFNPRRQNFPIDDPNAAEEQIKWEYYWLQRMDIFSMFFTSGKSDQPICMYELGRNLARMMERYTCDYDKRIVISVSPDYNRFKDVKIQVGLAWGQPSMHGGTTIPDLKEPNIIEAEDPKKHFESIRQAYQYVVGHDCWSRDIDYANEHKHFDGLMSIGDMKKKSETPTLEEYLKNGDLRDEM